MQIFFENELLKIKNSTIQLIERDPSILNNYIPVFDEKRVIVSSMRIDNIIAKIIETNRQKVKNLIQEKKVYLNNELLQNGEKKIAVNDTFSIRKYGKYRLKEIMGNTKKDNIILVIQKYIAN